MSNRRRPARAPAAPGAAFDAETVRTLVRGKRFLAADRAALDLDEIATWDKLPATRAPPAGADRRAGAVRAAGQHRPDGAAADAAGQAPAARTCDSAEDGMPDPFDTGTPRASGVHLHWAMPDALLRGALRQRRRWRCQPPCAAAAARPLGRAAHCPCRAAAAIRSSPAGSSRPTARWPCRWRSGAKAAAPRRPPRRRAWGSRARNSPARSAARSVGRACTTQC